MAGRLSLLLFFLLSLFATAQKVTQNAAAAEKMLKINEHYSKRK
jgi:hypothetical protein